MRARGMFILVASSCLFACGGPVAEPLAEDGAADTADPHTLTAWATDPQVLHDELAGSPVHESKTPFQQVAILAETTNDTAPRLEISTSADGSTWSPWSDVQLARTDDGAWTGVHATSGATHYRLRGDDAPLRFLSTEPLDATASLDAGGPEDVIDDGSGIITASEGLSSLRRYRFDLGSVDRAWLWLLRTARRAGWSGHLAGSRTGLRTYAQQAALYQLFLEGRGAPAFPPWGPSRHMIHNVMRLGTWAQAVDTQDVGTLISIARRHGIHLHTPYASEPWHVESTTHFSAPASFVP